MSLIDKVYTAKDMRAAAKCLFACEVDLEHDNRDIARMLRQAADMMDRADGNAAAMREALMEASIALSLATHHHMTEDDAKDCLAVIETAISEPPRNCDVGTSEEQAERFYAFCGYHRVQSGIKGMCSSLCPCIRCRDTCNCITKWAQMPYEAVKG